MKHHNKSIIFKYLQIARELVDTDFITYKCHKAVHKLSFPSAM